VTFDISDTLIVLFTYLLTYFNFWPGQVAWSTYKIFLRYSLITMQNLVTASHTVCSHLEGLKKFLARWYTPSP